MMKFLLKSFGGSEKSRTFAPAFEKSGVKKEFFERFTQTEVVQEASTFNEYLGRRNKPFQFLEFGQSFCDRDQIPNWNKDIIYSGEFDPGSG